MSHTTALRGLLRADARRVVRDRFLLAAAAYLMGTAVVMRWVLPWMARVARSRWSLELEPYFPLIVSYLVVVLGAVAVGILFLLAGTWYAANPFFKDDREYLRLPMRAEVDRFTGLLRQLNAAAVEDRTGPEFEQAKAAMHESVERMQEISMETMETTDPQTRAI